MNKLLFRIAIVGLFVACQLASAQVLTKQSAVALAEKFVVENGYTNAAPDRIKRRIDFESIEWAESRNELLKHRYNTLRPKAVGAKPSPKGAEIAWSVAFDYMPGTTDTQDICRVVTMDGNGSKMRIQHLDGVRKIFLGFD